MDKIIENFFGLKTILQLFTILKNYFFKRYYHNFLQNSVLRFSDKKKLSFESILRDALKSSHFSLVVAARKLAETTCVLNFLFRATAPV